MQNIDKFDKFDVEFLLPIISPLIHHNTIPSLIYQKVFLETDKFSSKTFPTVSTLILSLINISKDKINHR